MLSPADYAAYSRQTGRAYPQSEEEKAEMYGEVREFRENQLKAPSTLQTAGGIALGAGALAGIGAAAMKLRGRARDPRMQSGVSTGKSGVQPVDLSNPVELKRKLQPAVSFTNVNTAKQDLGGSRPRRIAENEVTSDFTQLQKNLGEANAIETKYQQRQMPGAFPAPEKAENTGLGEFQRFSQQADVISKEAKRRQSVYQDVAAKPEPELPPVSRPQGAVEESMVVTDPNTGEVYRRGGGRSMRAEDLRDETVAKVTKLASETPAQAEVSTPETLTETYETVGEPAARVQSIDAVDSASDQIDSKFEATVQRDVDSVFEGKPAVAAEKITSSARSFLESERDEIASQLAEQGLVVTPSRIEQELANRLGSEAYKYGPKYVQRKHAMELGATYDPKFFQNLNVSSVKIAGENVPVEPTKQTRVSRTEMLGTPFIEDVQLGLKVPVTGKLGAEMVQGKAEKKLDWLGSVRLEEANKTAADNARLINTNREYNALVDYQTEVLNALDRTDLSPAQRTRGLQTLSDVQIELDRLDARSEELNQRVAGGQGGARVRGAQEHVDEYLANLTPSPRLKPGIDEGMRIAYQVDAEGNPMPGTQELVSERRMKDTKAKGGGGRNVAEFSAGTRDDGGQIDTQDILEQTRSSSDQSGREYDFDQFGYRPGTGLTGEALEGQPFTDDRTQTGRVITRTGIQKTGPQPGSMEAVTNPFTQLDDETLGMISLLGSEADATNATRILARRRREGFDPASITGPGQSQRVVTSKEPTESGRKSILMSEAVRKAGYTPYTGTGKVRKQEPVRSSTLARTGRIDQEVANFGAEMRGLRRDIQDLDVRDQSSRMGPRSRVSGLEPQQRSIPGVTGYGARQRPSEADKAAEQLESYMARLQRGRSTPLTSAVVIQPKLF